MATWEEHIWKWRVKPERQFANLLISFQIANFEDVDGPGAMDHLNVARWDVVIFGISKSITSIWYHLISSDIIWSYITKSYAAQLMFESKQCQASSQLWSQWLDWTRGKDSLRLNSWNPQNIQKLIFLTLSSLTVNSRRHFRCCNTAFPQDKTHHQSGSYVATRYQHECQVNVFSYSK